MVGPHPRIDGLTDDAHLDFEPRSAVRWLGPKGLTITGVQVALSSVFAQYADKRELQAALKLPAIIDRSGDDGIWIDWLADTGDGFDATYATACLLAQPRLDVTAPNGDVEATPRASLLLLGGDLTYPAAAPAEYLNRFVGPYESAFPQPPPGEPRPQMLCIAGNHDWYDGLTTFLRLVCNGQTIGGWQTEQSRSYFVVKLPARWWIMGIDLALDYFIDTPQRDFFRDVAVQQMQPGDHVILAMHQPGWLFGGLKSETELYTPMAESNLQRFEREVLHPAGLDLRLVLAGDIHHYCRYERSGDIDQTRIVCGAGGTFLYPTHHIPDEILWPESDGIARYELRSRYPDKKTSERLRWRTLLAPLLNPSFVVFVGLIYLLFALAVRFSLTSEHNVGFAEIAESVPLSEVRQGLLENPLSLVVVLGLWFGLMVFADCRRWRSRFVVGGLHGLVHLVVLTFVIWWLARLLASWDRPLVFVDVFDFRLSISLFLVAYVPLLLVIGGLCGAIVFSLYLFLMQRVASRHATHSFSAHRCEDYRSFIRMRLDADGTLTLFPIGVRRVPRRWRFVPRGERAPSDPVFRPRDGEIVAHLIEPAVRIEPET